MTDIKDDFSAEDVRAYTERAIVRINCGNPLVLLLPTSPLGRLEHQGVLDGLVLEDAMRHKEPSDFGGRLFASGDASSYYLSVDPSRFKKIWDNTHEGRTSSKMTLDVYGFDIMEKKFIPMALREGQQRNADLVQVGFSVCPFMSGRSSTPYFGEMVLYALKGKRCGVKNDWTALEEASKLKVFS